MFIPGTTIRQLEQRAKSATDATAQGAESGLRPIGDILQNWWQQHDNIGASVHQTLISDSNGASLPRA